MTWEQSLEAFKLNKVKLSNILITNFDAHKNKIFTGRCMACSKNMMQVKNTKAVQLCKTCWDTYYIIDSVS